VKGKNELLVKRVSQLFTCTVESGASSFDVEMRLGSEFAKRF